MLYLTMVYTPLKVPVDHTRMCMHGFRFFDKKMSFKIQSLKEDFRGAEYRTTYKTIMKKYSVLNSAPRLKKVSISQLFTVFFSIFLKPHAQKKWDTFSGFGPTSLSYSANAAS